jgi:hypothetical protein
MSGSLLSTAMSAGSRSTHALPGADLIERGIADLNAGRETAEALLVSIGSSRLRSLGFDVSSPFDSPEPGSTCSWREKRETPRIRHTTG